MNCPCKQVNSTVKLTQAKPHELPHALVSVPACCRCANSVYSAWVVASCCFHVLLFPVVSCNQGKLTINNQSVFVRTLELHILSM